MIFSASGFEVVTWNVQKGSHKNWADYLINHPHVNYWGVQEATLDMESIYSENYHAIYNQAWEFGETSTGTLSLSHLPHTSYKKIVTKVKEPIVNTPKSFIVSDYEDLCQEESVKVINLHMINFRLGGAYKKQLQQINEFIEDSDRRLIVLGDFNNWNFLRTRDLETWAYENHLSYAEGSTHSLSKSIDHIFYRGLLLKSSFKKYPKLSDHAPLHALFECE